MSTTVINALDLEELNRQAVKAQANRTLSEAVIDRLDPDGINLVTTTIGSDDSVRALLLIKLTGREQPVEGWLDMSYENFNKLAKLEKRDGEWVRVNPE